MKAAVQGATNQPHARHQPLTSLPPTLHTISRLWHPTLTPCLVSHSRQWREAAGGVVGHSRAGPAWAKVTSFPGLSLAISAASSTPAQHLTSVCMRSGDAALPTQVLCRLWKQLLWMQLRKAASHPTTEGACTAQRCSAMVIVALA